MRLIVSLRIGEPVCGVNREFENGMVSGEKKNFRQRGWDGVFQFERENGDMATAGKCWIQ